MEGPGKLRFSQALRLSLEAHDISRKGNDPARSAAPTSFRYGPLAFDKHLDLLQQILHILLGLLTGLLGGHLAGLGAGGIAAHDV